MRHSQDFHRQFRTNSRRRRRAWVTRGELQLMVLGGVLAGLAAAGWVEMPSWPEVAATRAETIPDAAAWGETLAFGFCHSGGGTNCVVDGDTFWIHGERIRIADIDAPETHPSRCPEEARLGKAATNRLQALLNAGPIVLETGDRDTDRYGRKLRIVTRSGDSLGEQLVDEGLARQWTGRRQPWC